LLFACTHFSSRFAPGNDTTFKVRLPDGTTAKGSKFRPLASYLRRYLTGKHLMQLVKVGQGWQAFFLTGVPHSHSSKAYQDGVLNCRPGVAAVIS